MSNKYISIGGSQLTYSDSTRPPIGIPTIWFTLKPDWAIDFGNGADYKYLWENYPNLDNNQFKSILSTLSGLGWMLNYDSTGFYVPDLRGIVPIGYGTNAVRTNEVVQGGSLGNYLESRNKYHCHSFTGTAVTSGAMSANCCHRHCVQRATGTGGSCKGISCVLTTGSAIGNCAYITCTALCHTHSVTASGTIGYAGDSTYTNAKPSTIAVMWIVRYE